MRRLPQSHDRVLPTDGPGLALTDCEMSPTQIRRRAPYLKEALRGRRGLTTTARPTQKRYLRAPARLEGCGGERRHVACRVRPDAKQQG